MQGWMEVANREGEWLTWNEGGRQMKMANREGK